MKIKIFADGANLETIRELRKNPLVLGYTSNPTLMRRAGVTNYKAFAKNALLAINGLPISFEVFADKFNEMEKQARKIASWGKNVYVKIPIMNTHGDSCFHLIRNLSQSGIKVNVTAVMTSYQVERACEALYQGAPAYISVFAGRIADTGRDPIPHMQVALQTMEMCPNAELIWASPRELLNIFQADEIGCHVITVSNDILKKLSEVGKNLYDFSLETVKMFYNDAQASGFTL
ncbi:MAG: transaldolase [Thaumarchaeota archaeon]|nr:transaldolase [Nitrososphaerota archaeon]